MTPSGNADHWFQVPSNFRASWTPLPEPWEDRFGPLRRGTVDDLVVVGQIGQSIDGRIATVTGHSKYINGPAGLAHLHRLRALVDAVLVGIGTAVADDPQLTVRRVAGPSPARIVLDPRGRLSPDAQVLAEDGVRRLVITAEGVTPTLPAGVEIVRGCRAGRRDRAGRDPGGAGGARLSPHPDRRRRAHGVAFYCSRLPRPAARDGRADHARRRARPASRSRRSQRADQALRAPMRAHLIGEEVLLDCDLSAQRVADRPGEKIDVTDPHG